MTVKERILLLRLFERQEKNPEIMNELGIRTFMQPVIEKYQGEENKNT